MTTIQERHARATTATSLGMVLEHQGASDVLASAGWAAQGDQMSLGHLLVRLRAEADSVARQEIEQAADDITAQVLVLMRLQTLRPARDALGLHAARLAVRLHTDLTVEQRASAVSAALVHWLWQGCDACTGRGVTGGYGLPQHVCTTCHGSGRAKPLRLKAADQQRLADELLVEMDRKASNLVDKMARSLREA